MKPVIVPPKVIVKSSTEAVVDYVAGMFKTVICQTVADNGICTLALAGGTTPRVMYQELAWASEQVPWSCVEVFFGDERDVPLDNIESNYRMAQRSLLDHVPIQPARVHPMQADAEDIVASAAEYERTIRQIVPGGPNGTPSFDLILLGLGADGHTASLFPETELINAQRRLVGAHLVPVLGRKRMTFTFPLINAAHRVVMMVTGADKAGAVARLLGQDEHAKSLLPAAKVHPAELTIVLDAEAARWTDYKPE